MSHTPNFAKLTQGLSHPLPPSLLLSFSPCSLYPFPRRARCSRKCITFFYFSYQHSHSRTDAYPVVIIRWRSTSPRRQRSRRLTSRWTWSTLGYIVYCTKRHAHPLEILWDKTDALVVLSVNVQMVSCFLLGDAIFSFTNTFR